MSASRDAHDAARRGIARALIAEGVQWPALCAAVIAARGALGLEPSAFSRLLRVTSTVVSDLERGGCAPALAPPRLADVAPDVDWGALGVPVRARAPTSMPEGRHPAGHRPGRIVLRAT